VATHKFDHLTLVVSDAERALEGLMHSLQSGSEDMKQGALHARDLSGALAVLGMDTPAGLVDDVARQLTLGQPSVLDVAKGLSAVIAQAIKDIQLGFIPEPDQELQTWGPWASRLQVLVARDTAPLSSFQAVMPKEAAASPLQFVPPSDPGFKALRSKGLNLIQSARMANHQDDERTVRQMDAILSELQDWSLRVGQLPLSQLFPLSAATMADVWLDAALLDSLDSLRDLGAKANSMQAQARSLTVFMDWQGVSLGNEEYVQLGALMASVKGHAKRVPEGCRLVFPCSLTRMRMTPFIQNGQRYVVAASQFVQFEPQSVVDTHTLGGILTLRSGFESQELQVERVMPAENMNVFEVPHGIECPDNVLGVALDGMGEIYYCI